MGEATCFDCGDPVSTAKTSGNYQLTVGFTKLRPKGANEVAFSRSYATFICRSCADIRKSGMVDQATLFPLYRKTTKEYRDGQT